MILGQVITIDGGISVAPLSLTPEKSGQGG
jgi:hypothetical protein